MLPEKIQNILIANELDEYIPLFENHKLDRFDLINALTEDDFEKMGIEALGDRKQLVKLFSADDSEKSNKDTNVHVPVNVVVQESKSGGGGSGAGWGVVGGVLGGLIGVGIVIAVTYESQVLGRTLYVAYIE
jgi:hypothetical protein